MGHSAYRSYIAEQPSQVRNHSINILMLIHETMLLGIGNLADDIEGKVLKPQSEVAHFPRRINFTCSLKKKLDNFVDERFVLHEC